MKLLLTSNGLSNISIAKAFEELIGKKPEESKVAFIPTAANPQRDDNGWLIDDMYRIRKLGYTVDVVELTALKKKEIKEILEKQDAIFVGGGNTFYLSYWMQKTGLFDLLPELLKNKVYAGISAGSMIATANLKLPSQAIEKIDDLEDKDYDLLGPSGQSSGKSLKLVNFLVRPHLNSNHFPRNRKEFLEEVARKVDEKIYALDDDSAVKVVDGQVSVISEGDWLVFNDKL